VTARGLDSHHLVILRPKRRDQLLETGTIGPDAVGGNDTWLTHSALLSRVFAAAGGNRGKPGGRAEADSASEKLATGLSGNGDDRAVLWESPRSVLPCTVDKARPGLNYGEYI